MLIVEIKNYSAEYLSFEQCCEANALRHLSNAIMHEANGHPDYAIGSRRKAAKWRAKAKEIEVLSIFDDLISRLGNELAARIMNGN